MTQDEKEYVELMLSALPPVIARKAVSSFLGGVVSGKTLRNADSAGTGPEVAYRIGRDVAYKTVSLVEWVVGRYGIKKLVSLKELGVSGD